MIARLGKFLFRRQLNNSVRLVPSAFSSSLVEKILPVRVLRKREKDMPVEMENPYVRPKPKCLLCKHQVEVSYKNVRLLSQFVSPFSGRLYGRHITGLCERQHNLVEKAIHMAQASGLMPFTYKDPNYIRDPALFRPSKPAREHRF